MFDRGTTWLVVIGLAVVALALMTARPSRGAGHERSHVVRPGETLWTIATDAYDDDPREAIWRIEQRNGLAGRTLQPGTVIYLPP